MAFSKKLTRLQYVILRTIYRKITPDTEKIKDALNEYAVELKVANLRASKALKILRFWCSMKIRKPVIRGRGPDLNERLLQYKCSKLHWRYNQCGYRSGDRTVVNFQIGDKTDYSFCSSLGERYSRQCSYRKPEQCVAITVTPEWFELNRKGLSIVGDLFVLWAAPLKTIDGIELWTAIWLAQASGYSHKRVKGFLGVSNGNVVLAKTERYAIKLLKQRKNKCKE